MLNVINQNVYLPKMAPLKWGVGEFWCVGSFLELGEGGKGGKKAHPNGIILNN